MFQVLEKLSTGWLINSEYIQAAYAYQRKVSKSRLHHTYGASRLTKKGKGSDFDHLREFTSSDDIRHIAWKASLRSQKTYTKVFSDEIEDKIKIYVMLNAELSFAIKKRSAAFALYIALHSAVETCYKKNMQCEILLIHGNNVIERAKIRMQKEIIRTLSSLAKKINAAMCKYKTGDLFKMDDIKITPHSIVLTGARNIQHYGLDSSTLLGSTLLVVDEEPLQRIRIIAQTNSGVKQVNVGANAIDCAIVADDTVEDIYAKVQSCI